MILIGIEGILKAVKRTRPERDDAYKILQKYGMGRLPVWTAV